ncbi:MAG: hypothetical protein LBD47_03805, partial [Treponema sp.]|nr:hypothetical protein [Treponema sp.]
ATASVMSFSRSFVSIGIPSRGIPQVYHTFPFCPEKEIAPIAAGSIDYFARVVYDESSIEMAQEV